VSHNENDGEALRWNEIVVGAVHDIRTPLSAILTILEMLRDLHADSDRSAKLVSLIDRQVMDVSSQLERLLRDPGSFLKPPSGG
jgi:signal transduction histidine kinase